MTTTLSPTTALPAATALSAPTALPATTALPAPAALPAPVPRPTTATIETAGSPPDPDPPVPRPAIGPRVFRVCSEPPPVPSPVPGALAAPGASTARRDRPPEARQALAHARPCQRRTDVGPSAATGRAAPPPVRREPDTAARAVHALVRLLVETYDGRRPLPHLDAHLTPAALGYWRAVTERRHLPGRPCRGATRFTRIHLSRPRPDVAEVAVCLLGDPVPRPGGAPRRARALAARFEETGGRWRCSALRLG